MSISNTHKSSFSRLITLAFAMLLCGLCANASDVIKEFTMTVGQFNRLSVLDNVNVVYRCVEDSTGTIAYHGAQRFDNAFIFKNNNGKLTIQVNTEDVNDPELPTIYVYSDYLTEVSNSSDFTVTVEKPAPTPEFKATMIGNGSIVAEDLKATKIKGKLNTGMGSVVLSGRCEEAEYVMIGTGTIQADRLKADVVKCKILGSGSIGCWALSSLKTSGIGSTKIYYKGDPTIRHKGGGKLFRMEPSNRDEMYLPSADSDED